ncbi:MAG TPA: IclR family transcriptional regulator [Anaerolineales bacterium]|nr:IclR family transcriptional regulator [Anaerolineales bacterium]
MPAPEPYPGTQAVLRAVTLLKAFSDSQPELGLADLARTTKLNKTTAFRMLTALESAGLVAKNPETDSYRLGPEVIALGGRALRANHLYLASRPELESLAKKTGETITLEVLAGADTLILDEVLSHYFVGTMPSVGTRWPAHTTSTGKILLAQLPDDELSGLFEGKLARPTVNSIVSLTALRRELAEARERGFAVAEEELEIGFVAVGAAVRNHAGQAMAAISVGGPSVRMSVERIETVAPLVKAAAEKISKKMGYSGL